MDSALRQKLLDAGVSEEDIAKLEKAQSRSRRSSEDELVEKYSHVIPGSLRFDPEANKQTVEISCTWDECENTRLTFTSDLFQVRYCDEHRKAQKAEARKARAEELKALRAKVAELEG